jgi:hypothetical protein
MEKVFPSVGNGSFTDVDFRRYQTDASPPQAPHSFTAGPEADAVMVV